MNNVLVSSRVRSKCLGDPYTKLIQLKRTFRFLKAAQENNARVLILGNKFQSRINLDNFFLTSKNNFTHSPNFNSEIIDSASKNYDLILCLDPILFAKKLKNINLPRVLVSTVDDLYWHRDLIDSFDYLIPLTHDRTDQALHYLLAQRLALFLVKLNIISDT